MSKVFGFTWTSPAMLVKVYFKKAFYMMENSINYARN